MDFCQPTIRALACLFLLASPIGAAAAQAQDGGGIDYETARRERRLPAKAATGPIALDGTARRAVVGGRADRDRISCRTTRAKASRRPTTPKCAAVRRPTRSTSACSRTIASPARSSSTSCGRTSTPGRQRRLPVRDRHVPRRAQRLPVRDQSRRARSGTRRCPTRAATRTPTGTASGTSARASPKTAGMRRSRFRSRR